MTQLNSRSALLALAIGVASVAGCQKKQEPEAKAAAEGSAGATSVTTACDQFATQLCATSGEKSAMCESAKSVGKILPPKACQAALEDFSSVEKQIGAERSICAALAERLCNDVGPATESCAMVKEQTPQFPREQCEQFTQNYAKVVGELKQREAQNAPLSATAQAKIAATGAPSFGPENAKVTVVEFSDFECPFCSRAANVVHEIRKKYGDRVRFVFRQFPLPMHPQAHLAAQASLAAAEQGKFWEFHDLLFQNQRALTRESLETYAQQLALNVPKLKQALDGQTQKTKVDADVALGEEVFVNGTPTLFINGKRAANPTEFEPVAKMIDEALKS